VEHQHDSTGAWAKRYHLASRAVMEAVLRPFDLGPTQWYVLYQLGTVGPTSQRNLVRLLKVERATLSAVVAALVRKGLVQQTPDLSDQRRKVLVLTSDGARLWAQLPDPIARIQAVAFADMSADELQVATRVLRAATRRLIAHLGEECSFT
jgi:MarR family transcriptional regulator, lower aerobic nicotinate degradation pathway regulator